MLEEKRQVYRSDREMRNAITKCRKVRVLTTLDLFVSVTKKEAYNLVNEAKGGVEVATYGPIAYISKRVLKEDS
jgi:hypothetical protein